jgi:hypothetical protein
MPLSHSRFRYLLLRKLKNALCCTMAICDFYQWLNRVSDLSHYTGFGWETWWYWNNITKTRLLLLLLFYCASWYCQSLLFTNKGTSDCLKNNIKIYIKIAPTCYGAVTPSSGSSLSSCWSYTLLNSQLCFISVWLNQWWFGCIYCVCVCVCLFLSQFGSRLNQGIIPRCSKF